MDEFILKKNLKWIPFKKFKNIKHLYESEVSTSFKAILLNNNGDKEVMLKCPSNLNENLYEFLDKLEFHENCLNSNNIINLYGCTKDPDTLKYMAIMDYANKDLMEKCWNEDPLKRPSSKEVLNIIEEWIILSYGKEIENISEELKCNIMEFINAPIENNNP
ncbi:uncharacterized protein OCT59_019235 [Rhizophagus irregularis]|uniref:uncharacterized protein n=1 Tax=Rhizophagus irregularis TaxID=588596 RepID=UPI0033211CAD|nr:hypothetical protein OCT59_019235 [Rhizophagus irregularis]